VRATGIPSIKARNRPKRAGLAVACAAAAFVLGATGATVANGATPNGHGTSRGEATVSPHAGPRARARRGHSRQSVRSGHRHVNARAPSKRGRRKQAGTLPVPQRSAAGPEAQRREEGAQQAAERRLEAEERAAEEAEEAAEKMAEEEAG
jgi:hypothetical protein